MKTCGRCKRRLPTTEFVRSRQTKDGFYGFCKDCKYAQAPPPSGKARPRRGVTYADSDTHKQCRRCDQVKPHDQFTATPAKLKAWCRDCRIADMDNHNLAKYGLTVESYNALLESQGGVCAACKMHNRQVNQGRPRRLHVDHNHATGEVRGLLCHHCNTALGLLEESPERIQALREYLEGR